MGVMSLTEHLADLIERPVSAVATHAHDDHIGGHHEFDDVVVHRLESTIIEAPGLASLSPREAWGAEAVEGLIAAGYALDGPYFVDALPAGVVLEGFHQKPARVTRVVDEGDVIDLGDRRFEVLHLPGHSPGSIGLWEASTGTLFSGDALYDGPLLDELPDSDIDQYVTTMERLMDLPVTVVHAGHDPSFGRTRLRELTLAYLEHRAPDRY